MLTLKKLYFPFRMIALGLDGFTSCFFKKAWRVVHCSFTRAVKSFFTSGKLLGSFNSTKIVLVPKAENAQLMNDY